MSKSKKKKKVIVKKIKKAAPKVSAKVSNAKKIKAKKPNISNLKKAKKTKKVTKVLKEKKEKNKKVFKPDAEFPAEVFFKARIKVIGIGGGGGSIVSEIGRSLHKATFVVADTDTRSLKKKSDIKYLCFGQEFTHGMGTGANVDLGKAAAEAAREKIGNIFKDQDIIIFIASLGGGIGSGATQIFAETAKQFGGITFGIFTMPFKFEGKNKQRIALNSLKTLRQSLNVSLVIPNEKIFKIISPDTPITQAFSTVNKNLAESLESMIDLIYSPGIINIDFADLRAILKGRGNSAFINAVEESGKDRAEKICQRALSNPLLQGGVFRAEKILFNIAGSDNLSMFEVEKISRHISERNPGAKIIFGISRNPKLKNKIKTTVLMTGGAMAEEALEEKEEIIAEKPKLEKISKPAKAPAIKKEKPKKSIKKKKKVSAKKKVVNKTDNLPTKEDLAAEQPVFSGFEAPIKTMPVVLSSASPESSDSARKMGITEISSVSVKKTVRRSGLDVKKAEEIQEKRREEQEKEWEIPAFLRRVKYQK